MDFNPVRGPEGAIKHQGQRQIRPVIFIPAPELLAYRCFQVRKHRALLASTRPSGASVPDLYEML
jgi:hypothetical protein